MRRVTLAIGGIVVFLMRTRAAEADNPVQARCSNAYLTAQHLMHDRRLAEARDALLLCARDPCSRTLQPECAGWLADVQRSLPSVVVFAERGGTEVRQVHVTVDSRPFLDETDGTARDIDPGMHTFRVALPGQTPIEQPILIHEGERARLLRFTFPSPDMAAATPAVPPAPEPARRAISWPVYALGGLALGGAAGWTYFGVSGLTLRHQIDTCTGSCDPSRKQTLDVDWALADVSVGVTLVSLGLATYFFFRPPKTAAVRAAGAFTPVVSPARRGGTLGLVGRF